MVDLSGNWVKLESFDLVRSVHDTVLREFGHRALQYTDTAGAPEAREELGRVLLRHGFRRHEVLFTTSLSDSLRIVATALLSPGECIYPEDPTQLEVLNYASCGKPKAVYIQPKWRNPDGYTYSTAEIEEIAGRAPVAIYDLTYSLLSAETQPRGDVVIGVGSLHPLFPGLHLGFLAVPQELFPLFISLLETTYLHPPTYMQYVLYIAMRSRAVDKVLEELRRREKVVKEYIEAATTPYFAWLKTDKKSIFIKHGALDGSVFSWRGGYRDYVRLGLTSASETELADFLSKISSEKLQGGGHSREL